MRRSLLFALLFFVGIAQAQFTGSYNVGTGETYTTLKSLFDAINAGTVDGDITINITSDLTEASNIGLGVNTNGYHITIQPSADENRTVTFTQLADNTSPTGHLVIGYPGSGLTSAYSDANTIATSRVTINGYASGGSTRRLTFTNTAAAHVGARVIVVVGACDSVIIKNCIVNNLTTSTTSPFCIGAVVRKGTAIDVAPSNLIFENNVLTSTGGNVSMGVRLTNSGTPTSSITGFVFRNNQVTARRRLLEINYTNGANIYNNEFTTLQTGAPGTVSYGLWTSTSVTGTLNIYNNKFLKSTTQETGAFGHRVVSLSSGATYNIYNNMFAGMDKTTASTVALNLTYLFYSGVSGTIYHNTFYMPALTNASSTGYYSCIQLSGNTATIKNNIFVSDEATHSNPYFVSAVPTPVPDYNNYYMRQSNVNHKVVSTYTTLSAYQSANLTKDVNSKSVNVAFADTSTGNLHIAGSSNGDVNLIGVTGLGVATDIDGTTRSSTYPYIGADEASTALPVELTSFTAVAKGKNVELKWSTATETNNHGFDVERSLNGVWTKIGFVVGAGYTNAPKEYGYVDAVKEGGRFSYRLKQIDRDGKFTYINAIEVVISLEARSYELAQNFPNPFNPVTTIRFSVKQLEQTSVRVYDITGKQVAELFNGVATPGQVYNVQFNGTGLASGMYLYVLQTPTAREVKKMTLLK